MGYIKDKYSLTTMSMGDKVLQNNTLFKQLNKRLENHATLMEDFRDYQNKLANKSLEVPEKFRNMNLKVCLHQSLRDMLDEIIQTNETHYKKNYLAKVNQWYTQKIK